MNYRCVLVATLLLALSIHAAQQANTSAKPGIISSSTPPAVSTTTAPARKAGNPAWQFSDEERFTLRSNPALARQRAVEHSNRPAAGKIQATSADPPQMPADSFDGKTHPELFFPSEVFTNFVNLAYGDDARTRDIVRHYMGQDLSRYGFPPDVWQRLDGLLAVYLADIRAERDLLASRSKTSGGSRERVETTLALKRADVCRSRAEALTAVRNEFGRDRVERFLYETVAINMFYMSDTVPAASDLRKWEGGCR